MPPMAAQWAAKRVNAMPILRRDQSPDPLAPHVLYLWRRKWWVILPTIAVFVMTYAILRMVPEDFQARAELFVNRQGYVGNADPNPLSVATLLKSDEVLMEVRNTYAERFNVPPPVFERFARQFTVKTEVLQDTATRRDVSPVVVLSVQATGREETRFLMQAWTQTFIRQFGNYVADEAVLKLASLRGEEGRLEEELTTLEREQARLMATLPMQEKTLAEKIAILAPADLRVARPQQAASVEQGSNNVQVSLDLLQTPARPAGLLARLADAEVEAAALPADAETSRADARRGIDALRSVIGALTTEIDGQTSVVEDLRQRFATASRRIAVLSESQRQLRKDLDVFLRSAAVYREFQPGDRTAGGDVRVISQPVTPELRVWPKRTVFAGVAALVAMVICITVLVSHRYLTEIARQARSGSAA